jgi:acyl transferase domain-containing protein
MRQTAVIVAPGRGTYNRGELGYLARHHPDLPDLFNFDAVRAALGQVKVSELDRAHRFSSALHTRGDNASGLIFACGWADFQAIDRDMYEVVGVTGNSMGWYTALTCAGALTAHSGFELANTMGTLMQKHMIGGQIIHPVANSDWRDDPARRDEMLALIDEINGQPRRELALSIDLGGYFVLAGNDEGLAEFEARAPAAEGPYPMRLAGHAGFHSSLQRPVSDAAKSKLNGEAFGQPVVPLIDGRGGIWHPGAADPAALWDYTLGHQVTETYDFSAAIQTAAREFMPDIFIILGPGETLGGSVISSLIRAEWRGWRDKQNFRDAQSQRPWVVSMGDTQQRPLAVAKTGNF